MRSQGTRQARKEVIGLLVILAACRALCAQDKPITMFGHRLGESAAEFCDTERANLADAFNKKSCALAHGKKEGQEGTTAADERLFRSSLADEDLFIESRRDGGKLSGRFSGDGLCELSFYTLSEWSHVLRDLRRQYGWRHTNGVVVQQNRMGGAWRVHTSMWTLGTVVVLAQECGLDSECDDPGEIRVALKYAATKEKPPKF